MTNLVCRIIRSEEHTSELQSLTNLVCRLLLEKKKMTDTGQVGKNALRTRQSVKLLHAIICLHFPRAARITRLPHAFSLFFFNDTATTEIYTLSLHDVFRSSDGKGQVFGDGSHGRDWLLQISPYSDRKSTRLNSSHDQISYAVFCLKKKEKIIISVSCSPDKRSFSLNQVIISASVI